MTTKRPISRKAAIRIANDMNSLQCSWDIYAGRNTSASDEERFSFFQRAVKLAYSLWDDFGIWTSIGSVVGACPRECPRK